MKQLVSTLAFVSLIGFAALAYGQSKPLADKQLDLISAGSAIANGESTATDSREFEVELGGSSLNGASGVNITNAADSTIGNGANVWSADHLNDVIAVTQANVITQKGIPCDCGDPAADVSATATKAEIEADVAVGNAIALDGSKATFSVEGSVELSGSSEANAKALNITNASMSLVGNGVNLASASTLHNLVLLTQANVITQLGK